MRWRMKQISHGPFYPTFPQGQQEEAVYLKEEIEYLSKELDAAKTRLSQLEAIKSEQT